jgi:hypothetical protein
MIENPRFMAYGGLGAEEAMAKESVEKRYEKHAALGLARALPVRGPGET